MWFREGVLKSGAQGGLPKKLRGRSLRDAEENAEIWKGSQWSGLERDLEGRAALGCVPLPPPQMGWAVLLGLGNDPRVARSVAPEVISRGTGTCAQLQNKASQWGLCGSESRTGLFRQADKRALGGTGN